MGDLRNESEHEGSAIAQPCAAGLPEDLVGLVNPQVWDRSVEWVQEKLRAHLTREAYKQLYIEALADHLLKEVRNANDSLDCAA